MKTNKKPDAPEKGPRELTEDRLDTVLGGTGLTPGGLENIGPKEDLVIELKTSALEMSNVDIAKEFEKAIRSRRAGSPEREITVDDGMLRKVWEIRK